MSDATVSIHDDRIVSISPARSATKHSSKTNADVIDGHGLYLAPGLIDSHCPRQWSAWNYNRATTGAPRSGKPVRAQIPRSYLYFGFTTLIGLNSTPERIVKWNARESLALRSAV